MHGAGITALVDGQRVAAGTPALLASAAGVCGAEVEAAQAALDKEGGWMGGVEHGWHGGSRRNKRCILTILSSPNSPCFRPSCRPCRCYWLLCGGGRTAGGLGQVSSRERAMAVHD